MHEDHYYHVPESEKDELISFLQFQQLYIYIQLWSEVVFGTGLGRGVIYRISIHWVVPQYSQVPCLRKPNTRLRLCSSCFLLCEAPVVTPIVRWSSSWLILPGRDLAVDYERIQWNSVLCPLFSRICVLAESDKLCPSRSSSSVSPSCASHIGPWINMPSSAE